MVAESLAVLESRFDALSSKFVEDLLGDNKLSTLETELGRLTELAELVDDHYSRELEGIELIEYAGCMKHVAKSQRTIRDAISSCRRGEGINVIEAAGSMAFSYAVLFGLKRKMEYGI